MATLCQSQTFLEPMSLLWVPRTSLISSPTLLLSAPLLFLPATSLPQDFYTAMPMVWGSLSTYLGRAPASPHPGLCSKDTSSGRGGPSLTTTIHPPLSIPLTSLFFFFFFFCKKTSFLSYTFFFFFLLFFFIFLFPLDSVRTKK